MADTTSNIVLPDGASIVLELDGAKATVPLARRDDGTTRFSTGSAGYHAQGKVMGKDSHQYQLNIVATLIDSNPNKVKKAAKA